MRQTPKPLLASEALRDELAPYEPSRRASQVWVLLVAVGLSLLGLAMRRGLGITELSADGAAVCFSAAGGLATVALLPFPYALRAAIALLIGAVLTVLGLRSAGPLAGLVLDGGFGKDVTRIIALVVLPAALLFRSAYRAYRPGHWLLAAGLLAATPFVIGSVGLALDTTAPPIARWAAGVGAAVVAGACVGFASTPGLAGFWAVVVLASLPLEYGAKQLTLLATPDTGRLTYGVTAFALSATGILMSLGLFQLLAASMGADARAKVGKLREPDTDSEAGASSWERSSDNSAGTPKV